MMLDLQKKIDRALRLLESAGKAAQRVGQPLEVCYSGGKDSDVILALAKMSGIEFRAIYKNTTIDPPGTIAHCLANGVEIMQPQITFAKLIEKKGFPSRKARFCCSILKEYKILDYAIVGIRREESWKRARLYTEPEICRTYGGSKVKINNNRMCFQYFPILDWSSRDIESFIVSNGIKCHPLYYNHQGTLDCQRRLGCMGCPLQSRRKRILNFMQYPGMIKLYCKYGNKYRELHPSSPNITKFKSVYDWLAFTLFCDNMYQFDSIFEKNLFGVGIDAKKFLEDKFSIIL